MNDPPALGIALIGTEFMGRAHSHAWRNVGAFWPQHPVSLKVLVGQQPAKTRTAAADLGWDEHSTDWMSVVTRPDIDIVDICTPGHLHADIAVAALEAGKHVITEKPLASTLHDAERMSHSAMAARTHGTLSMVGFNYRRVPALALAKEIIQSGRIGEVRQMRVSFLQDWLADAATPMSWRLRKEIAGSGVLGDLGSHLVDQVHFLLGETITEVSGQMRTMVTERPGAEGIEPVTVDDAFWATAFTSSGVAVSLEASRMATGRKASLEVEIYGSTGGIRFDLQRLNELWVLEPLGDPQDHGYRQLLVTEPEHPYMANWWPPGHVLGWENTFTSQAADFLHAIATGEEPRPSFEDALMVERVLATIQRSADTGGSQLTVPASTTKPGEEP
ncbi:MAG TPA: Gfo/Idh/MocA family oxidoreductase [Terrimesophilobacter sp.]|nr:Gfo/Idh/MocA family oxidoreductase [Terrimesophilobacter sp.]HRP99102.1 Gfo/Idh/MocA family oxidoreductase [Terrimesophilobacter sp.]